MVTVRRQFIDAEYGQMHVRIARPDNPVKPPLVCLHMSPKSGRIFARFMAAMAEDRIVVAPDYPGFGESDPPAQHPHVRVEDYASSVWQAVDALDLGEVDFLGYHTGSMVAAEAANKRPGQCRKLILIGAPVINANEIEHFHNEYKTVPLDKSGTRFLNMWKSIQMHAGPGQTLELMAESFAENLRAGENYEWGHRAAFEYAPRYADTLKSLQHRIWVINPNDDLSSYTVRVSPLLQNGEIVSHNEWGHGFLDTDTAAALAEFRDLLDRS